MIYLTGDQHFGHANIIKYTNRPYDNVDDMNEDLIYYWNDVVNDDDTVYHLGDFALGDTRVADLFWRRLNGELHILKNPWHHDKRWLPKLGNYLFPDSYGVLTEVVVEDPIVVLENVAYNEEHHIPAILCHYPFLTWDRQHYGSFHFHGHSHGTLQPRLNSLDVGVDNIAKLTGRYRPISLEEAIMWARDYEELQT